MLSIILLIPILFLSIIGSPGPAWAGSTEDGATPLQGSKYSKNSAQVLLTGSSTLAPLVATLAQEFEKAHSGAAINVQTGGSSKGVTDCVKGLNDLGMISRELKDSEQAAQAMTVAADGLAFLSHKDVGITSLTPEQITQIYRGEVKNWKEFGGTDTDIVAVSKAEGRGAFDLFKKYFQLKSSEIKAGVIVGDEALGVKTISATKGSIGFVSVISANQAASSASNQVFAIQISGVAPNIPSLRSGKYPYMRNLQIVKCRKLSQSAQDFLDFAMSPKGQKLVEEAGYVSLER